MIDRRTPSSDSLLPADPAAAVPPGGASPAAPRLLDQVRRAICVQLTLLRADPASI